MKIFAALDVSDKSTHVCVVDGEGVIVWRGVCATDPAVLAVTLARHAPGLERVVMETGPLSAFLYHGLIEGITVTRAITPYLLHVTRTLDSLRPWLAFPASCCPASRTT